MVQLLTFLEFCSRLMCPYLWSYIYVSVSLSVYLCAEELLIRADPVL